MKFLCEDVAQARPSPYALKAACDHLRLTHKYPGGPSIAEVIAALKGAEQQTAQHQHLIAAIPAMQQRLDAFAQDLPRLTVERARQAARRAQEELRACARLRQLIEDRWPPDDDGLTLALELDSEDLHRLGLDGTPDAQLRELTREEVLARVDQAEQAVEGDGDEC
jgi:hypothetical protein